MPPPALTLESEIDISRLVAITGAGFSKHAHPQMPVLSELGVALVELLKDRGTDRRLTSSEQQAIARHEIPMGNVEAWLTSMAAKQPFHSSAQSLQRRSLFEDMAADIASIIANRERETLSGKAPSWLARLVTLWHHLRSTIVTFNYDTLIEATMSSLVLWGPEVDKQSGRARADPQDAMGGFPPKLPRDGQRFDRSAVQSLRLLKLHGSLNWWGRPTGTDLFSIVQGYTYPSWGGEVAHVSPMVGLTQVIIPPVADKSGEYLNPTVETLWAASGESLSQATAVLVFGYSLPSTDATAAALVAESLPPEVPLIVIDPYASDLGERWSLWLPNPIVEVGSLDPEEHRNAVDRSIASLEACAATLLQKESGWLLDGTTNVNCYPQVHSSDGRKFDVARIEGDRVVAGNTTSAGFRVRPDGPSVDPKALGQCRFVSLPSGRRLPIYGFDQSQNTTQESVVYVMSGPA